MTTMPLKLAISKSKNNCAVKESNSGNLVREIKENLMVVHNPMGGDYLVYKNNKPAGSGTLDEIGQRHGISGWEVGK